MTTNSSLLPELAGASADATEADLLNALRGKTPEDLTHFLEVLDAHLRSIHQDELSGELRDKTPAEQVAFDYGLKLRDLAIQKIDQHRAVQDVFRRRPKAVEAAMLNTGGSRDSRDPYGDIRRMSVGEARDRALRTLDDRNSAGHLEGYEKDAVEKQVRTSTDIARRILVTENESYRNAWLKLVTRPNGAMYLTEDERQAMVAWDEYRTMSEGTTTAGGFGIPVNAMAA